MSKRRLTWPVALFLVLELAVGALIWFHNSPAAAQTQTSATTGSAATAAPDAPKVDKQTAPPELDQFGCPKPPKKVPKPGEKAKTLADDLIPIGILILVITVVVWRLPKVELGHSVAFKTRRLMNWLPLGLTYSLLYFARYNIKQYQGVGLSEAQYGTVFGVGAFVYGIAFLLNGPLTDRWGGRATILIAAAGAGAANLLLGYMAVSGTTFGMTPTAAFAVVFAINMYFQSFGAVSIVKVNASWFHMRERGTFAGIFGILISLGLYFAFDIGPRIKEALPIQWVFWIPAIILLVFFVLSFIFVRNNPSDAGHADFDLGDATSAEKLTVVQVFKKLLTHPVILTISAIELCSGFLRQAILQWGPDFAKGVGQDKTFVFTNWGMVSCLAGILGGMFAGAISDHVFQSRRSPVSGVLYGLMLTGAIMIVFMMKTPAAIGWVVALMSMAIIGVHGMLTATASADFAGKANTGVAVGIIDGFVYLGSTVQSFLYGAMLPASKIEDAHGCMVKNDAATHIENWKVWPYAMIPIALIGFLLTLRIWNARPTRNTPAH
ncbi:MAG TPA: MFS transporter [Kofleriaceae bacterium]|jgi:OPA family glycerol-3-phosphate transporter-like MFS transporter